MDLNFALIGTALDDIGQRPGAQVNLQAFLADGGDPDVRIRHQDTTLGLLECAVINGWDEAVHLLLAAGADVHAHEDRALRWAVEDGQKPIVDRLLAAGADVHVWSDAPLRRAVECGHLFLVERLLIAGADVHALEDAPLRLATRLDHRHAIAERLCAAGADVHVDGEATLRDALNREDAAMIQILLRHGASIATAWGHLSTKQKRTAAALVNRVAAAVPSDQQTVLVRLSPYRFPGVHAVLAAARRRTEASWTKKNGSQTSSTDDTMETRRNIAAGRDTTARTNARGGGQKTTCHR